MTAMPAANGQDYVLSKASCEQQDLLCCHKAVPFLRSDYKPGQAVQPHIICVVNRKGLS